MENRKETRNEDRKVAEKQIVQSLESQGKDLDLTLTIKEKTQGNFK